MTRAVSVKLPERLKADIDQLVEDGVFVSQSDALRFGARLAVTLQCKSISERAEAIAVDEIREKLDRVS